MDAPDSANAAVTEQISRALMPHMLSVETQLNRTTAALRVAAAEDGSYDNSPKLEKAARRLEQVIKDYAPLMEQAVSIGGLPALNEGLQYEPVLNAANEVLDILADIRAKAAQRVNTSVEMAANEAMNAMADLVPMMHPDAIMPIVVSAVKDQGANA